MRAGVIMLTPMRAVAYHIGAVTKTAKYQYNTAGQLTKLLDWRHATNGITFLSIVVQHGYGEDLAALSFSFSFSFFFGSGGKRSFCTKRAK